MSHRLRKLNPQVGNRLRQSYPQPVSPVPLWGSNLGKAPSPLPAPSTRSPVPNGANSNSPLGTKTSNGAATAVKVRADFRPGKHLEPLASSARSPTRQDRLERSEQAHQRQMSGRHSVDSKWRLLPPRAGYAEQPREKRRESRPRAKHAPWMAHALQVAVTTGNPMVRARRYACLNVFARPQRWLCGGQVSQAFVCFLGAGRRLLSTSTRCPWMHPASTCPPARYQVCQVCATTGSAGCRTGSEISRGALRHSRRARARGCRCGAIQQAGGARDGLQSSHNVPRHIHTAAASAVGLVRESAHRYSGGAEHADVAGAPQLGQQSHRHAAPFDRTPQSAAHALRARERRAPGCAALPSPAPRSSPATRSSVRD